jgi:hypothetical protein
MNTGVESSCCTERYGDHSQNKTCSGPAVSVTVTVTVATPSTISKPSRNRKRKRNRSIARV